MTYGDPITAEEQRWYDELLKKGYIDQGYAVHWKNDSHAERIEFHREIVAIEKETAAKLLLVLPEHDAPSPSAAGAEK